MANEPRDTAPQGDDCDGLRPDRARFVELRASGETIEACAAAVGIDRSTAFRWLRRGDVRRALAEVQAAGREVAAGILGGLAARAAERLGVLLESDDEQVSVRAATVILDRVGLRGRDGDPEEGDPVATMIGDDCLVLAGVQYRREEPH